MLLKHLLPRKQLIQPLQLVYQLMHTILSPVNYLIDIPEFIIDTSIQIV